MQKGHWHNLHLHFLETVGNVSKYMTKPADRLALSCNTEVSDVALRVEHHFLNQSFTKTENPKNLLLIPII